MEQGIGVGAAIDRRSALLAGSALAATAALRIRPAQLPAVTFGVNRHYWDQVVKDVPLLGAVRIYYGAENDIPAQWPHEVPGWATLSIRPNPTDLLSGQLDAAISGLISSAPPHSELTFWHENISGNPLGYPSYVNNPRTAIAIQKHGQRLCAGTNVGFGVITCGPAAQQDAWVASGLNWYGDDLYEFPRLRGKNDEVSRAKLFTQLDQNLAFWRIKSGRKWPKIRACESNTPFDSQRARWFTWLSWWMAAHNGRRLITYWNAAGGLDHGGLSGPWPPGVAARRCLRKLSETYQVS